jgi:membrane protein YdbS with pleckstrin-like domain
MEKREAGNARITLKDMYPVSYVFIIKRNIRLLLLLFGVIIILTSLLVFFGKPEQDAFGGLGDFIFLKKIQFAFLVGFAVLIRLGYDYLYWLRYNYYIQRGRLHIESGVLIRQAASVPINQLCEFYLEKGWIDFFLGTQDLVMKAAIGEGQEVCRIRALKEDCAKELKYFLIRQGEKASIGSELTNRA